MSFPSNPKGLCPSLNPPLTIQVGTVLLAGEENSIYLFSLSSINIDTTSDNPGTGITPVIPPGIKPPEYQSVSYKVTLDATDGNLYVRDTKGNVVYPTTPVKFINLQNKPVVPGCVQFGTVDTSQSFKSPDYPDHVGNPVTFSINFFDAKGELYAQAAIPGPTPSDQPTQDDLHGCIYQRKGCFFFIDYNDQPFFKVYATYMYETDHDGGFGEGSVVPTIPDPVLVPFLL